MWLSSASSNGTPISLIPRNKGHGRRGTGKKVRCMGRGGALWSAVFQKYHRCHTPDLLACQHSITEGWDSWSPIFSWWHVGDVNGRWRRAFSSVCSLLLLLQITSHSWSCKNPGQWATEMHESRGGSCWKEERPQQKCEERGNGVNKRNTLHMREDMIVKHYYTIIGNISGQGLLKGRDPNLSQQVHEQCLVWLAEITKTYHPTPVRLAALHRPPAASTGQEAEKGTSVQCLWGTRTVVMEAVCRFLRTLKIEL